MNVDRTVASIKRARGEELRVVLGHFKGRAYVHIRTWFLSQVDGEWHPTHRGVTVAADDFGEFEAAMRDVRKLLDELPQKRPDRIQRYVRWRQGA